VKVAINQCFGGFGISNEAFEKLLSRKGIAFERTPAKFKIRTDEYDYYHEGHAGSDDHYLSEYTFYEDRSDPDLIAVIEEMGESSWGWAADIAIVDIPDDVQWQIEEYDGREHIAEKHRTWY
jgi:hypothetical protein